MKVITMHSSKGLEYPVVIVIGLEKEFSTKGEREKIMFDKDLGLFANYFDKEKRVYTGTGYREIVKAKMRNEQIKEEMRLLYVATTRAKYSLHLVMESESDPRKDGAFEYSFVKAGKFSQFIPLDIHVSVSDGETSLGDATVEKRKVVIGASDAATDEKMRKDLNFTYPWAAEAVLPIKNSVTAAMRSLNESGELAAPPTFVNIADTEENAADGLNAEKTSGGVTDTERGNIAHRIMQYYDFDCADFSEEIKRLIKLGVITEEEFSLIDGARLQKAALSPALKGVKGKTLYREKDFIVYIPADRVFKTQSKADVLLQGVIDLLAVNDGYADVIDYKYSRRKKDTLIATYKTQLDLYAYAAEKAAGVKVRNKILVNLFSGESFVIE